MTSWLEPAVPAESERLEDDDFGAGLLDGMEPVGEEIVDTDAAGETVWACTRTADSGVDPARIVALAARAVVAEPNDARTLALLGAALYRAGRTEDAIATLTEARRKLGEGDQAEMCLFLALAHQRLGHAEESRKWRARAAEHRQHAVGRHTLRWAQRVSLDLLEREAEKAGGAG